jgi:acyl-CoA synthetase (AMP-forming)/AMP-acid ligase II
VAEAITTEPDLCRLPHLLPDQLATALLQAPRPAQPPADAWRREVAILFTSGTSGLPKGCILTNEYVLTAGAWYRDLGGALTLRHGQERLVETPASEPVGPGRARGAHGLLVFLEIFRISFTPLTVVLGISRDGRRYRLHQLEPSRQTAPEEHLKP